MYRPILDFDTPSFSLRIGRYWTLMHSRLAISNFVNFAPASFLRRDVRPFRQWRSAVFAAGVVLSSASCGGDVTPPDLGEIKIASIVINGAPFTIERGTTRSEERRVGKECSS